jgi:RNA polymerase sigma factor (sigma-70 family)
MQVSLSPTALNPNSELVTQAQQYLNNRQTGLPSTEDLERAWNEFYCLYSEKIRKFAFASGATEEDVADCIQEAWTELLVRLPTFWLDATRGRFDSWVFQVVRSKVIDSYRSKKKCRVFQETYGRLESLVIDYSNPVQSMAEEEVFTLAWRQLRKRLSKCSFQVFQMRLLEERSVSQVADQLGLSHKQVWYRYHRAQRQAKEIALAWVNA